VNGFMNFGIWSMDVGTRIRFGTRVDNEIREHYGLPIRAHFLLENDDFIRDDWLSGNWESTRSHKDEIRLVEASFGVDLTLFLAPLVGTFLGGGVNIVLEMLIAT